MNILKSATVFILFLIINGLVGQDKLTLNTGELMLVKVTEISKSDVKYKAYSNLNGPTYLIKRNKIDKIIYENG